MGQMNVAGARRKVHKQKVNWSACRQKQGSDAVFKKYERPNCPQTFRKIYSNCCFVSPIRKRKGKESAALFGWCKTKVWSWDKKFNRKRKSWEVTRDNVWRILSPAPRKKSSEMLGTVMGFLKLMDWDSDQGVCVCVCVCVCLQAHPSTHAHTYICMQICIRVWVYV